MFHRSFQEASQAPPVRLSEAELLVLACGFWSVPQCELFAREDLQLVLHRRADGRYAYLREHTMAGGKSSCLATIANNPGEYLAKRNRTVYRPGVVDDYNRLRVRIC